MAASPQTLQTERKEVTQFVVLGINLFDSLYKISNKFIEIMKSTKGIHDYANTYYYQVDKLQVSLEVNLSGIE